MQKSIEGKHKKEATLENQSISILQYTDHEIPDILPDLRIDKIVFQKVVSYFFWKITFDDFFPQKSCIQLKQVQIGPQKCQSKLSISFFSQKPNK